MSGPHLLVITDQLRASWATRISTLPPGYRLSVCVLATAEARYRERNQNALRGINYEIAPLEPHVASAERALQSFYPKLVDEFPRSVRLGGITLLELLRSQGPNRWWFGESCEKGPLRGPFSSQLFWLALISHVIAEVRPDEVWVHLEDPLLADVLVHGVHDRGLRVRRHGAGVAGLFRSWLGRASGWGLLARMAVRRLIVVWRAAIAHLLLGLGSSSVDVDATKTLVAIYSRYPILWRHPFDDRAEERYFTPLVRALEASSQVMFWVMISMGLVETYRRRKAIQRVMRTHRIVPCVRYLMARDYLSVLTDLSLPLRYIQYHRRMAPHVQVSFLGWDVSGLWDAEVRRTLTGPEIPQNLLLWRATRRLASGRKLAALIHPLEFQPMERALWAACEDLLPAVAVQHSTFSDNHFMYYFTPRELARHIRRENPEACPMPALFIAAGIQPGRLLADAGVPAERMAICGAVRYDDLRMEPARPGRDGGNNTSQPRRVLVLTSISRRESGELIETVTASCAGLNGAVQLLFKSHYHCRMEDFIRSLLTTRYPQVEYRVLDVNAPLKDEIRKADIVVVGGTTAAVEALAAGQHPIVYSNPSLLNLSSLKTFPRAATFVSSPEQMRESLVKLISNGGAPAASDHRDEVIEALFYRLDGLAAERIVEALKSRGWLQRA